MPSGGRRTMPPNNHRPAANPPASPRSTAKYTNKDGSKFITVPKAAGGPAANPSDASPVSPLATPSLSNPSADTNIDSDPAPTVNRKKQKRRQKAAAKAAAEQAANGHPAPTPSDSRSQNADPDEAEALESDVDEDQEPRDSRTTPSMNGHQSSAKGKKNKKKKKKGSPSANDGSPAVDASFDSHVPQPLMQRGLSFSRDKIWSTSNHEERERIKEFWLGLGEDERKSLVKVEKDAVLKKMKEQQKHTCSCTVCGRKRTAIEEELEGLYDAYYLELEQFASQGEGPPMLAPPPRDYPTRPSRGLPAPSAPQPPGHRRIVEHVDLEADEDDLPEEDLPPNKYDYQDIEVDVDDFSDDEPPDGYDDSHERDVADFLTFGNSLQVKGTQLLDSLLNKYGNMDLGGILTVADDLLKNDGKRFIEMMEQLAERRMAREEDAREHVSRGGYGHPNGSYSSPHNQPPPDDEDYEDEEDEEEDYEDSEDEEYEDEEEDQMTEEQRMEEGRRMFQIFAARMFEQRVLSAYKEKVAKERQQKLLEELEEESRQVDEQKAKKAKNAQKKKDKAAQKKQALAEEKARKEAEKAAEEAARLEAEQRRINDQKQKAEEKRKAREAQKRAEEEARLKKEADRQRKLHEQREKQAEQERKAREAKEHEKKLKEEQRLRDKETREQKDREAQERKEKQERDKREKEARAAKAQREAQEAREAKEKAREEKAAAQRPQVAPSQPSSSQPTQPPTQPAKRGSAPTIPVPTVLPQHPPNPASYASPKIAVATPALPKGPTPMRPRNASQQQDSSQSASQSTSSQNPSPHPTTPNRSSPGPIGAQRKSSVGTPGSSQIPQTNSPLDGHPTPFHLPPMNVGPPGPPPGLHHMPPGFPGRMSQDPNFAPPFRPGPNMMMPPLGMNGPRPGGFPPMSVQPPPGFAPPASGDGFGMGGPPMPSHQRQGSAGFDGGPPGTAAQPIGRPAPIRRPGSVSHGRSGDDKDDETKHLGSSALVDDEDDTLELNPGSFRNNQPPGPRGFGASPYLESAFPIAGHSNPWGPPGPGASPFGPASFGAPAPWGSAAPGVPAGFHVGSPVGGMSGFRPAAQPRHVAVRLMLCQACRELGTTPSADADGFITVSAIKSQVENISGGDTSISEQDLLDLCDTEGSPSNGGGTFDVRRDEGSSVDKIRFMPDHHPSLGSLNGIGGAGGPLGQSYRPVGGPGEIGSPLMSQASIRGGV